MNSRTLIVARLKPEGQASEVAGLFAASDTTELPRVLGVTRRTLFLYRDLYFHYVEFDGNSVDAMVIARSRADFRQLSIDLDAHIAPFDPSTWHSPADAMASEFYSWEPAEGGNSR